MINGGSEKLLNLLYHSCTKIGKKNYQNVLRSWKNIKNLIWLTEPILQADSLSSPGYLIRLKGPICDVIFAMVPFLQDTHTYSFYFLPFFHVSIIGKIYHNWYHSKAEVFSFKLMYDMFIYVYK